MTEGFKPNPEDYTRAEKERFAFDALKDQIYTELKLDEVRTETLTAQQALKFARARTEAVAQIVRDHVYMLHETGEALPKMVHLDSILRKLFQMAGVTDYPWGDILRHQSDQDLVDAKISELCSLYNRLRERQQVADTE